MRPLRRIGHRFREIFRDDSSWAEFASAMAVLFYVAGLLWPSERPYELRSMQHLTDLLPGWWWPAVCACGALYQMSGLLARNRFIRASAGFGMCMWVGFMVCMIWPILPGHPMLFLTAAWALPNMFVVARHAREW